MFEPKHALHCLTCILLFAAKLSHEVLGHFLLILHFVEKIRVVRSGLLCGLSCRSIALFRASFNTVAIFSTLELGNCLD